MVGSSDPDDAVTPDLADPASVLFPACVSQAERLRLLGHPAVRLDQLGDAAGEIRGVLRSRDLPSPAPDAPAVGSTPVDDVIATRARQDDDHYPTAAGGEPPVRVELDERVLARRLVGVLELACEHLDRLTEYRAYWADTEEPLTSLADKVVVESAILALIARRSANRFVSIRGLIDKLARTLAPQARSYRNEIILRRYPHAAMSLGIAHVALSAIGYPDAHFDALVSEVLRRGHADCTERLPYRAMEYRWLLGLVEGRAPDFADLMPMSIAARTAHPIYMLATDVYALTHVPMFVTDFGNAPPPAGFPSDQYVAAVEAALAWVVHIDNYDLMGELVLARALWTKAWTPNQLVAWRTLEYAWDELGFLASPSFAVTEMQRLPAAERPAYAFRNVYHTTYVAGMLCAVLLGGALSATVRPAPVEAPAPNLSVECRSSFKAAITYCTAGSEPDDLELEQLLDASMPARIDRPLPAVLELLAAWQSRNTQASATVTPVIETLPLTDTVLAAALADGLLSCAARAYDLPMLAQTLRTLSAARLPVTPTVATAARFLIRQQLPNGAIGGWSLAPENKHDERTADVTAGLASSLGALSRHLGTIGNHPTAAGHVAWLHTD